MTRVKRVWTLLLTVGLTWFRLVLGRRLPQLPPSVPQARGTSRPPPNSTVNLRRSGWRRSAQLMFGLSEHTSRHPLTTCTRLSLYISMARRGARSPSLFPTDTRAQCSGRWGEAPIGRVDCRDQVRGQCPRPGADVRVVRPLGRHVLERRPGATGVRDRQLQDVDVLSPSDVWSVGAPGGSASPTKSVEPSRRR